MQWLSLVHLDALAVDLDGLQGDDIGVVALVYGGELQGSGAVRFYQDGDIANRNLVVFRACRSAIDRSHLFGGLGDLARRARSQRQSGDGGNGNNGTAAGGGLQGLHVEHPPSIAITGLVNALA